MLFVKQNIRVNINRYDLFTYYHHVDFGIQIVEKY